MRIKPVIAAVLLAGFVAGATACQPISTDPMVRNKNSVLMVGDSIMMSASWSNDAFDAYGPKTYSTFKGSAVKVDAFMGKKVTDYQSEVADYGSKDAPARLVIELGTNDSGDGWDAADVANYQAMVNSAPNRSCIVAVLPTATKDATAERRAQIGAASSAIRKVMAAEPRKVIADSAEFAAAHPSYYDAADGIHLRTQTGDEALAAQIKADYAAWIWSKTAACQPAS